MWVANPAVMPDHYLWGRSYGFVHRILTETGVTLRGRGGATRRSKSKVKH